MSVLWMTALIKEDDSDCCPGSVLWMTALFKGDDSDCCPGREIRRPQVGTPHLSVLWITALIKGEMTAIAVLGERYGGPRWAPRT